MTTKKERNRSSQEHDDERQPPASEFITPCGDTRRWQPPRLYSWSTSTGAGGVTSDKSAAVQHLHTLLTGAGSGATGTVDRVALDAAGSCYLYLTQITRAWHDVDTDEIVWAADG